MCKYKVGDQVTYSQDPDPTHIYTVTATYPSSTSSCTYDIRLNNDSTTYQGVPEGAIRPPMS
jgi:hypothetical protein